MLIRWRLTLFIALAIAAILLVLGVALFFLLSEAQLSTVEDPAEKRARKAADIIRSGRLCRRMTSRTSPSTGSS